VDKIECVARIPLFEGFPKRLLRKVSGLCVERRYREGQLLCREGASGVGLFFIIEGRVEVFGISRSGGERRLAVLGPGEVVGEMMILDNQPRSASVRSLEPVLCYLVPQWDFKRLMRDHPEIAVRLLPTLAGRIRELDRTLLA